MIEQVLTALSWYILVTALGWLVWPLAFRLLPGLPDRGYTLSRALSLLLVGYVFWLLGVLGLLQNTLGGILLAVLLVGGASVWINRAHPDRSRRAEWLAENRQDGITTEIPLPVAFFCWALFSATNPDIR